ncbi:hypothetical protein EON64_12440 [archaeon]|nr:MAG: hypothetical protein EON64_12440 [archaeon]
MYATHAYLSESIVCIVGSKKRRAEDLVNRLSENVPDFIGTLPTSTKPSNKSTSSNFFKTMSSKIKNTFKPSASNQRLDRATSSNTVTQVHTSSLQASPSTSVAVNTHTQDLDAEPADIESVHSDPDYQAKMQKIQTLNQQRMMQMHTSSRFSQHSTLSHGQPVLEDANLEQDGEPSTSARGLNAIHLPPLRDIHTPLPFDTINACDVQHQGNPDDTLHHSVVINEEDIETPGKYSLSHQKGAGRSPQHIHNLSLRSSTESIQEIPMLADEQNHYAARNHDAEKDEERKTREKATAHRANPHIHSSHLSPSRSQPNSFQRHNSGDSMASMNSSRAVDAHHTKQRTNSIFSALNYIRTMNYNASNRSLNVSNRNLYAHAADPDSGGDYGDHPVHKHLSRSGSKRRVTRRSVLQSFITTNNKPIYNNLDKTRDKDIDSAFTLAQPEYFFDVVRGLIMFIALLWALFFTNFIAAAPDTLFILLALLPVLLSTMLYIMVVMRASLLMAVHSIDTDAMLEIIEQTEGSKQLGKLTCMH